LSTEDSSVGDLAGRFWNVGMDIMRGIWNGIAAGWGWLTGKVSSLAGALYNAAKSALGIASPSKVFQAIGAATGAGLALGITGSEGLVESAAAKLATSATASFTPVTVRSAATAGAALAAPRGVAAAASAAAAPVLELRTDRSRFGELLFQMISEAARSRGVKLVASQ
jgi:hypothetical protein